MKHSMLKLFSIFSSITLCINKVFLVEGSFSSNVKTNEGDFLEANEIMPRAAASIDLWPKGQIPYTMAANLTSANKKILNQVIQEIENSSCVRFTPRKTEADYISIVNNRACSGTSGRKGGNQVVSVNCDIRTMRLILMKVIGFEGMHQRFDRDDYIYVYIFDEVFIIANSSRFPKNSPSAGWQLLNTPYDTQSVTHYYNIPGIITIHTLIVVAYDGSKVGGSTFTKTDFLNINRLYNCDSKDCWNATNCNGGLGPFIWKSDNYGQIVYANRCDFYSNNIGNKTVKTRALCQDLCLKNLNCTHFTWNVMNEVCYQKQSTNPYPLSITAISNQRGVCGYVNHRNPPLENQI